jgi:hypothetical protein
VAVSEEFQRLIEQDHITYKRKKDKQW